MYGEKTLKILRMRIIGLDAENDTNQDDKLQEIPPLEALRHLVTWEFGHGDWCDWFIEQVENVGGHVALPVD